MPKHDFWSRRRAAVAAEDREHEAALETEKAKQTEAELEVMSDAEVLAEFDLPDPDTLENPEDIRAFLAKAPLQRLKMRALRRMWRLNPVLANLDGLLDYGEDFTDSAMVIENMQTAYQVGKGMLKHIEALAEAEAAKAEAQAKALAEDEADAPEQDSLADSDAETASVEELAAAAPATDNTALEQPTAWADQPDVPAAVRPRRMTFTFDDQRT